MADTVEFEIDGIVRTALVVEPETGDPEALVLVFHGHGGSPEGALKSIPVPRYWPQVRAVYAQGLPTPSRTDPEGKRTGWQKAAGEFGDRDLLLVERLCLEYGSELPVIVVGHSNGGGFCYLLWALRSELIDGLVPSGTSGTRLKQLPVRKPRPVFHIAGRRDFVVPFASQEKAVDLVRSFNSCSDGDEWDEFCTFYPSEVASVASYFTNRSHDFPVKALGHLRRFFLREDRRCPVSITELNPKSTRTPPELERKC